MSLNLMRAVILGGPGSGKGTISVRIVRDFAFKHLSSGDILRSQISKKTVAGIKVQEYMKVGQLVPDDLVTELVIDEICQTDGHWLLDGFPRTKNQAESLHRRLLSSSSSTLDLAINLDVPTEIIVDRIRGRWTHLPSGRIYNTQYNPPLKPEIDDVTGERLVQREDDKPEVVLNRLETYNKNVGPVLDYYRSMNILQEFHGKESNEIWPRIHSFLSKYVQPKSGPF